MTQIEGLNVVGIRHALSFCAIVGRHVYVWAACVIVPVLLIPSWATDILWRGWWDRLKKEKNIGVGVYYVLQCSGFLMVCVITVLRRGKADGCGGGVGRRRSAVLRSFKYR